MAGAGYDIGVSGSQSITSGASQSSAFDVTGGGGKSGNVTALAVIGGAVLVAGFVLWLIFRRK